MAVTTLMCIPVVQDSAPDGSRQSQCFEEVRILDYIRSYQTTGRAPCPFPIEPSGDRARAALGLPPHFTPWVDPTPLPPPPTWNRPLQEANRSDQLPRVQVFVPARIPGGESHESINCAPPFLRYSFEELRCIAYNSGLKHPPVPVPTPPLAEAPVNATATAAATPTLIFDNDVNETLEHISTNPSFSKHSPEELRVAFVRTGRELNSQQLLSL
ncbi:hypothetical protein AX15_003832 [Amanita polypyramis BW_CC]|nr:hypothetical protein AX15_003832 [Amanita polypyramis BW_CC]